MKCSQCGAEFKPQRSTAKYCSSKCRKLAFQGISVPDSVPKNAKGGVSVPAVTDKIKVVPADEWRRDYLELHAGFFNKRLEATKDCVKCQGRRTDSDYKFCNNHLEFPEHHLLDE